MFSFKILNNNTGMRIVSQTLGVALSAAAFCAAGNAYADPQRASDDPLRVEFVISEPCSLVNFVDTISQRYGTTTWFRDWYLKQCHQDKTLQKESAIDNKLLTSYKQVLYPKDNPYKFIDQTGRELGLDHQILALSGRSSTLPELYEKLSPIIKPEELQTLKDVFGHFAPIYHRLVWEPRLASLERQLEDYRLQAAQTKMAERLTSVHRFMKAPWPQDLPFTVVLHPLPVQGKHTHGDSMGSIQTVDVCPKHKFSLLSTVVFHEDVHALWLAKKDMHLADRQFAVAGRGALPQTEIYEGMACALGQGWFAEQAFGKQGNHWYGDKLIDAYSHAVYPLYAEYVNNRKEIDPEFGRQATLIYFDKFADEARNMVQTSEFVVFGDQLDALPTLKTDIARLLPRLRELDIYFPINSPEGLKEFNDSVADHVAVLLPQSKLDSLTQLGVSSSQIAILKEKCPRWLMLRCNEKQFLFCMGDTPQEQAQMLVSVLKKKEWPLPAR